MFDQIIARIVGLSQAIVPEKPWQFLNPVRGARWLPPTTIPETLEVLQQEFTAERLLEARVLVQDQAGELQLSPVLTGSGFLVLRPSQDGAPFDIVSGGGSLASCEPPAFRCHEDFYTRTWCNEPAVILVALCDVDLALLRMLSIPSTPAAGLRDLTGKQVRRLFGLSNRHRTVPEPVESPTAGHDYRFVIVGCRLAGLLKEVPSEFTETISRLSNVEKSYRISTSERFAVWEPTDGELDQMRSAVEFIDRPLVRHAIMQSVSRSTLPVRRYIETRNALLIHNLCTARRELTEALNKSKARRVPTPELSQKFEAFNRCYRKTFVEPIENSARSLQQPEKQGLGLLAADLMRHWHEMSEFVREVKRVLNDCFVDDGSQSPHLLKDGLKEKLKMIDSMVKIHRELMRKQ